MDLLEGFAELRPPLTEGSALVEADRCLDCGGLTAPAPCVAACPASVDVPRFVRQIALGTPLDAARTIYDHNVLGGTCARVCPAEVLCEGACVLAHEGQKPIAVAALQRFATDRAGVEAVPLKERAPANGFRVAVVGAGPAGLACAGELAARGFEITVHDEHEEIGGTVRSAIAPYRQVVDPLPAERAALVALGVRFKLGRHVDAELLDELAGSADALFLGVGLGADRRLGCAGEELAGVWPSLVFIDRIKRALPVDLGERLVVVGGGNTAIDVAREAVRLGCPNVTLAYRRTRGLMPAYGFEVDEALEEGVRLELLAAPVELLGDDRVERVVFDRMQLGEPGPDGRPRVAIVPGRRFELAADTVVVAIGQQQRRELEEWLRRPGVFAGGDAVNGGASVVQAVAEGARAARAIEEALCAS
jgi:dihydropyrimidine dehydrogenase (NAD+) subunit PreT